MDNNTLKGADDMLPVVADNYFGYMKRQGKAESTIKEYKNDLIALFKFLGEYDITTITTQDLDRFLNSLDIAAKTLARKIATLKSFFNYLIKKEKSIIIDPAIDLETPKFKKSLPKHLKIDESQELLKSINTRNSERDFAIVTLFLNCGLRLSELVSINLDQIKGDTLVVCGKGNKERTIYLNESCIAAIEKYITVRSSTSEALFLSERNQRISKRNVEHMVKKLLLSIGKGDLSTHKLRHTAATLLFQSGVDIRNLQEILGHESVATTQIYTHVDKEQLRQAVKQNPLNIK
jgi:integrase/recombinase XerD